VPLLAAGKRDGWLPLFDSFYLLNASADLLWQLVKIGTPFAIAICLIDSS
jgi:hypothetical protein